MNKNSALFWLPRIQEFKDILIPLTKIIEIDESDGLLLLSGMDSTFKEIYEKKIEQALESFKFPIFIKTDDVAGKHDWKDTCYVEHKEDLYNHIKKLIYYAKKSRVEFHAILLREFLHLESPFNFFDGNMPVAKERRYFIKDGHVICHHPYWDEEVFFDTFNQDDKRSSIFLENRSNKKEKFQRKYPEEVRDRIIRQLREINTESEDEILKLSKIAAKVSTLIDGLWSVDFACDKSGKWYLLDMALAKHSWHPTTCMKLDKLL
ncbi:hypothetical protein NEF87_000231 [Candidatus Lokiarchaeum ossiferum]|uniref:ATP-grasp domain-containing protein n=1 Tax=Candidatus Lokiarchaeum ossiferum TaxID=2951803 RepID=A0ABY6HK99_9ARCH|nr:hypothetical protein NEF87_000231 [Candidatus Lokiarchaeum sp. B-35]